MTRIRFATLIAGLIAVLVVSSDIARAQDPLTAYPNNYKLIFENADVQVMHVHYGPHEKVGVHDHSRFPTVYVYLNDAGQVRYSHEDATPFTITRSAVKAGSFRVSPGRLETHTVENLGDQATDFLRIEMKKLQLGHALRTARQGAPATLEPGTKEEFSSPELTIQRVVVAGGAGGKLPNGGGAALMVALGPMKIAGVASKDMQPGDVAWVQPSSQIAMSSATSAPAQVLLLTLHSK